MYTKKKSPVTLAAVPSADSSPEASRELARANLAHLLRRAKGEQNDCLTERLYHLSDALSGAEFVEEGERDSLMATVLQVAMHVIQIGTILECIGDELQKTGAAPVNVQRAS